MLPSIRRTCGLSPVTILTLVGVIGVAAVGLALVMVAPAPAAPPWRTVAVEHFDAGWESRWHLDTGTVAPVPGGLVSTGDGATILRCKRRLDGPFAVEYTAAIAADAPAGDLSLILWRDSQLDEAGNIAEDGVRLMVQIGAYEGSYSAIIHADATRFEHQTASPFHPEPGHSYRVRVVADGQDLTVLIDGKEILHHVDPVPLVSVHLGLFAYYKGKSFSDVRLDERLVAATPSAAAVGDAFLAAGDGARAAVAYERAGKSAGGDLLAELSYKQGLALTAAGHPAAARGAFLLAGQDLGRWGRAARLAACDTYAAEADGRTAQHEAERAWATGSPVMCQDVERAWSRWIYLAANAQSVAAVDSWLAFRTRLFPESFATEHAAADALLMTGRAAAVVERFPRQRRTVAVALLSLGRPEEVAEHFRDQRGAAAEALCVMGQGARIAAAFPEQARWISRAQLMAGGTAVMSDSAERARLWQQGPLAVPFTDERTAVLAAGLRGDWPAVLAAHAADQGDRATAQRALGQELVEPLWIQWAGLSATVVPIATGPSAAEASQDIRLARARWLLIPALNRSEAVPDGAPRWALAQRPWCWTRALAGDATALDSLPDHRFAAADRCLVQAVLADRAGETAAAAEFYAAWLKIPAWQRDEAADPVAEDVVRGRLGK